MRNTKNSTKCTLPAQIFVDPRDPYDRKVEGPRLCLRVFEAWTLLISNPVWQPELCIALMIILVFYDVCSKNRIGNISYIYVVNPLNQTFESVSNFFKKISKRTGPIYGIYVLVCMSSFSVI